MAEVNPQVMEMVEAELKKNPDVTNQELLEKAKGIDRGVSKLTPRQFNARYPLQVKRMLKPRKRGGRKKSGKQAAGRAATGGRGGRARGGNGGGRDQVRKILLQLAKDVAGADKGGVVDVIAGIDRYVDRVVKARA